MLSGIRDFYKRRRARKLFRKPPKKATPFELIDFYNNEIIKVGSSHYINNEIADYLSTIEINDLVPVIGKPEIFKTRDKKKHGILNLKHLVFLCGETGRTNRPVSETEFAEWSKLCQDTLGFPLAPLPDKKGMEMLGNELEEIIRYNDPKLAMNANSLLQMVKESSGDYLFKIADHFDLHYLVGSHLLYQFSDKLFLSYYFGKEITTEKLRAALIESKDLIDRYFEHSRYDKISVFPVERERRFSYQIDYSIKSHKPEKLEISKEVEDIIEKVNLDFSAYDKLVILLKIAQSLLKSKPGAENFGPVIDRLYKLFKYSDTPFETSRLLITEDHKILLPDYELEIQMQPLHKALYILFYRHPEGILITDLDKYRDELCGIYTAVSNRRDPEVIEKTINELLNPASNTINECLSRIREAFLKVVDERIARLYYISGERGGVKRIFFLNQTNENS